MAVVNETLVLKPFCSLFGLLENKRQMLMLVSDIANTLESVAVNSSPAHSTVSSSPLTQQGDAGRPLPREALPKT
jgi:hypothetical protein